MGTRQPQLVDLGEDFLVEEVQYLLGRFGLDTDRYIRSEREGRGSIPVLSPDMKRAIAEELVPNYQLALQSSSLIDWDQMRDRVLSYLQTGVPFTHYEVVVIDEAQDLCALQIRIALELVSPQTRAINFIKDGTQRIYKANYVWDDVGLEFGPGTQLELEKNYRNTRQIARVAASLMRPEAQDDDLSILDPSMTIRSGPKPVWVKGRYTAQQDYLVRELREIDLDRDSVAICNCSGLPSKHSGL